MTVDLFLIPVFLRSFACFLSSDFLPADGTIQAVTMRRHKEFTTLAALLCIFGDFQEFFHQLCIVMYHHISEIGTDKVSQTMLYAQRIIPIIIKYTTFT